MLVSEAAPRRDVGGRELLAHLAKLARLSPWSLAPLVVFSVGVSLAESATMGLMLPIIQALAGGGDTGDAAPRVLGGWLRELSIEQRLRWCGLGFLVMTCALAVLRFLNNTAQANYAGKTGEAIRQRVFANYLARGYGFFIAHRQGRLLEDITKQPNNGLAALMAAQRLASETLTALMLLGLLLVLSWPATLAALAAGLVLGRAFGVLRRRIADIGRREVENQRAIVAVVAEAITGIRQIKLMAMERALEHQHDELSALRSRLIVQRSRLNELPSLITLLVIGCFIGGGLVAFAGLSADSRAALLPIVGVFAIVTLRLLPIVSAISSTSMHLFQHAHSLAFLSDALEPPPAVAGSTEPLRAVIDAIRFEQVSFRYPALPGETAEERRPALTDVELVIPAGRRTALVGPTGSGKSTVLDLLVRLFEPDAGRVTIDGRDVRSIDASTLRRSIGHVSQDTFLFHGTIRQNLCAAGPASQADLERAARLAHAYDFIAALPAGFDTLVGDRGVTLSGGERQRLAIARAVVHDPPILLLDEATSALDRASEERVRAGIAAASAGRTVIVVAHRPSAIADCDFVYSIREGRIVERGTPSELLAQGGYYASMVG